MAHHRAFLNTDGYFVFCVDNSSSPSSHLIVSFIFLFCLPPSLPILTPAFFTY